MNCNGKTNDKKENRTPCQLIEVRQNQKIKK